MTDVAHSTIAESNLHENKGVAGAASDTVATANGSGATVWKKLTASNLDPSANSFGANLLHVREETPSNVASSQVFTTGNWNTIILNTVKTNEIVSATLSSNQISLPAGTYFVDAWVHTGFQTGGIASPQSKPRLRNITDAVDLVVGPLVTIGVNQTGSSEAVPLKGRFTLTGTKIIEFQMYSGAVYRPTGGSGSVEVFSDLMIWKIS